LLLLAGKFRFCLIFLNSELQNLNRISIS